MSATRLDGKACAEALEERLKQRILESKLKPHLAVIIVGDDPASHVYVRNKIKSCERLGIKSTHLELSKETSQEELVDAIISMNNDDGINGILIQSPLPSHLDEESLTELPTNGDGSLKFSNVNFKYGNEKIFDDLTFEIEGKKTVAIVGSTGSGKSTLAYLLPRLYELESGSIEIDGVNIKNLSLSELRSNVSLAFEESFLFSNTARENISLGLDDASQEEIEDAALIARAHDFIAQLPESYETKVGERGYGLSGGQRQRIALARAILRKPRVLVLDDALSAVDASTEEEIRNELNQVMSDMTTLIITNRVPTIELCDEVVFIENGKVKAQGKHQELMESVDTYKSLFLENQTSEI